MRQLLICALILGLTIGYAVWRSLEPISHYRIPPIAEARTSTGIVPPLTSNRWQPLRLQLADGSEAVFGCAPNWPGGGCLSSADYARLVGRRLIIRWFDVAEADTYQRVVLAAVTIDGSPVVAADVQRATLLAKRARERADTPVSNLPLGIFTGFVGIGIYRLGRWGQRRGAARGA